MRPLRGGRRAGRSRAPAARRRSRSATVPAAGGDPRTFRVTDFLRFAGVDPASRGQ
jgi:hypothetical protein